MTVLVSDCFLKITMYSAAVSRLTDSTKLACSRAILLLSLYFTADLDSAAQVDVIKKVDISRSTMYSMLLHRTD